MDVNNSRRELEVEERVQTAALLSLAGVSCLLSRQWHSTVDACTDTMCSCLKSTCFVWATSLTWLATLCRAAVRGGWRGRHEMEGNQGAAPAEY